MDGMMKIKAAHDDDIANLLMLYRDLNPDDKETKLEDALGNFHVLKRYPGSEIFVGCIDEKIISSCTLIIVPNLTRGGLPYALIENVVTHRVYRNRGYGKAILKHASESAWSLGCYKVMLLTGSKRPEVLKFYERAGFEQSKTGFQMRRLPARMD